MDSPLNNDDLYALGRQMSIPVVDPWLTDIDTRLLKTLPARWLYANKILPFAQRDDRLQVATADPFNMVAFDELRIQTGLKIEPVLARESAILYMLRTHLP